MTPLNKRSALGQDLPEISTKNTQRPQCHALNSDNADETQLITDNYFPAGHCMTDFLPYMMQVLDTDALIEVANDVHITYRQMLHNAVKLAAWLVEHVDRTPLKAANEPFFVHLYGDNSIAGITAMYAGWLAGASLATASPMWMRERFQVYCERVNAAVLVIDARIFETMDANNVDAIKSLSLLQHVIIVNEADKTTRKVEFGKTTTRYNDILNDERTFGEALHFLLERRDSIFETNDIHNYGEEIAFLGPSSGTTGVPKSIILTHNVMVARMKLYRKEGGMVPDTSGAEFDDNPYILYAATLSSVGIMSLEHFASYTAQPKRPTGIIISLAHFDPCVYAGVVEKYRIKTLFLLVPHLLRVFYDENMKAKFDLSSVELCLTGAWPLKPKLQRLVAEMQNWPLNVLGQGYGTTEAGLLTSSGELTDEEKQTKIGSIGRPSPHYPFEIKLVDLETNETITTPYKRGEFLVRTTPGSLLNPIFKGYYKNEEKTRETLTDDGWYHTGDVVYFDEDKAYWHVERIAELVWLDDNNWCAPAELEESLLIGLEHEIADVALVAQTKSTMNAKGKCVLDRMVVFVEPRKVSVGGSKTTRWATDLSEKELKNKVCSVFNVAVSDERLHLIPECVHLCSRLPRNNSKIMRSYLRDMLNKPEELSRCLQQVASMAKANTAQNK